VLPTPEPVSSTTPSSTTPLLMDGVDWLAAIERRIPQVALDWPVLPTPEPASSTTPSLTTPSLTTPSLTTPLLMDGVDWLAAIERRIPQVALDWPVLPTEPMKAELVAEPLEAAEPAAPAVGEKGQYGPVAPNERLWTIAAKLRPDPSISTSIMVQALFAANPQAFSQENMDFLKVDAILRIPTLREIVEYTGSLAAQQLLELDQQNQARPTPANGEEVGSE
jgi:FimV-like protein